MTAPQVVVLLDAAATAITLAFTTGVVVVMVATRRSRRPRRMPYRVLLGFCLVLVAIDVPRLVVLPGLGSWLSLVVDVALVFVVLFMRRVLNRLDRKLQAYIAETARLRAKNEAAAREMGIPLAPWAKPDPDPMTERRPRR